MKNKNLINYKKKTVLNAILKGAEKEKFLKEEKESNSGELTLKSVELYEPVSYEYLLTLNKKKYRNLKIRVLKAHLDNTITNLNFAIDLYKDLINRTEYWERKSTYDFNFKDWNTLKKANGKLTRYFNDICSIKKSIDLESEE